MKMSFHFWGVTIVALLCACGPAAPVDPGPTRTCMKTSPRVGWRAELATRAHGVMGTVTVIDDCTLELTNFIYDGGGGQSVRVTGGLGGRFNLGIQMGPQLRGTAYDRSTLRFNVPEGIALTDFDAVSIWCETFGVNFGDGTLTAP
jgi:hypothetical protein